MSVNVGVNVVEVDGPTSPAIQPAATSVAAFVGKTERGLPNRPVRVTSVEQFAARFGGRRSSDLLHYALDGFFLNGGREAYVSRVVSSAAVPAGTTLADRQGAPAATLRVAAGYRGEPDPGSWGDRLSLDVRDDPAATTTLTGDTVAGATTAVLTSVSGFDAGGVARFHDGATDVYRRLTQVDQDTRTVHWADPLGVVLTAATIAVTTAEFRVVVRYRATADSDAEVVETWPGLSMESGSPSYIVGLLNHPFTGSRYITVTDVSGSVASGVENPAVVTGRPLGGSSEPAPAALDFAGDPTARTGLRALDTVQLQLLASPDLHSLNAVGRQQAVSATLAYCANRGDCMFVGASPDRGRRPGLTFARSPADYVQSESDYLAAAQADSAPLQAAKVFGALYAPWIQVADPVGSGPAPTRYVPPDGHVLGVYARTDLERGIFKAPAGIAAIVRGALGVAAEFTDGEHTDLVETGLVNGIRPQPGPGIVVAASRTLSTDTRWWFVGVRLLFNFVKSSLRDGLRFVRQEPHSDALRRNVRFNVVTPFLLGLWRQGAFGSDPPNQVFSVKCDAENNPPEEVDQGNFRVEVYFFPVKPAEIVLIVVGQQPSGGFAREQ
jgi:phage tail sheath protein FI